MPDNPESQELTSQNGEKAPKQKESLVKKTWNRVPAPARVIAGATLTLAGLAGVVKGQEAISQNNDEKPEQNVAERTIEPTTHHSKPTRIINA